jgi:hypothetical protein
MILNMQGHQAGEPVAGRARYPEDVGLWDGDSVSAPGKGTPVGETLWNSSLHCSRDSCQVRNL